MSDTRTRELERTAAKTGGVEDRAALIVARARGGATNWPLIELAAYLGSEAAQVACGWPSCENTPVCESVRDARGQCQWCRRVDRRYHYRCQEKPPCEPCRPCIALDGDHADFLIGAAQCYPGREAAVRIVLAAVGPTGMLRSLRSVCRECQHRHPQGETCGACVNAERMVKLAERWVLHGPSKKINREAHKLCSRYVQGYQAWWVQLGLTMIHADSSGRRAVRTLGDVLGGVPNWAVGWEQPQPIALEGHALSLALLGGQDEPERERLDPRSSVEAEVLPWTLGEGDPLRARLLVGSGAVR